MKKTCSICKLTKPITQYFKNCRSKDGFQKHCKSCHKTMADKWEKENKGLKREIRNRAMAVYRKKYPEKIKQQNKKYRELHGERYRENKRQREKEKKIKIILHYGGKCECCGEKDYRFLCIDHINNDGYLHRKQMRQGGKNEIKKTNIYTYIIKNNYPDTFRILCFNCNFARAFYGGKDKICPHQLDKGDK